MAIRYLSGINVDSNTLFVDDANNRVGIGTASPATALDVNGTISVGSSPIASFSGNYNRILRPNGTVGIYLGNATDAGNYYDNTTHYFRSSVGSSVYAVINYLGNVGIGTTSPISIGAGVTTLDIQGSSSGGVAFGPSGIKNYIYGASTMYIEAHTTAVFTTSGTEKMRLTTGGQFIVGGTTVGYSGTKLQVGNTSDAQNGLNILTSTTGYGYILFGDGEAADTYVGQIWYYHGDNYMGFQTNGSEKLRITSSGNVGIGTTAPQYKLDVAQVIRSSYGSNEGAIYLGSTPAGVAYVAGAVRAAPSPSYSYTGKLSLYTTTWGVGSDYGITEQMYIETSAADTKSATAVMLPWGGNVGIGTTSPSGKLTIYTDGDQTLRFTHPVSGTFPRTDRIVFGSPEVDGGSSAIYGVQTAASGAPGYLSFYTTSGGSSSEKMRIASTGATRLNAYGSGSFTGTVAYNLAVDSSGNVIETAGGVVDGSGTANYVSKWQDANTLTNSLLYDNGSTISIGLGSTTPSYTNAYGYPQFAIESNAFASSHVFTHNDTNGNYSFFALGKSKGTAAAPTIVENSETIGDFQFWAYDGAAYRNTAFIRNQIDGEPGAGDVPGRLVFGTTNDGSSSSSEKMRITAAGNVGIGTTAPGAKLDVAGIIKVAGNGGGYVEGYRIIWETPDTHRNIGANAFQIENVTSQGLTIGYSSNQFVVVNTSGNVGIGTTSPSRLFDVSAVNPQMTLKSTTTTGFSEYYFSDSAGDPGYLSYAHNGDYLAIGVNSAERMRITSAGNVGIGTTAPTYKLDVVGEGRTSDAFMAGGAINIDNNLAIQISSAGAGTQRWIGINKNNGYGLIIGYVENAAALSGVGAYIRQVTSDPIHFLVNNATTAMSIVNSGNVGIGTTSPVSKLHIDNALGSDVISISDAAGSVRLALGQESSYTGNYIDSRNIDFKIKSYFAGGSGGNIFFQTGTGTATTKVTINVDGNVGIGTTAPSSLLNIVASGSAPSALTVQDNARKVKIGRDQIEVTDLSDTAVTMYLQPNANLVINSSAGNVGIGVQPTQKLHVSGNIRVTGAYYDSNNSAGSSGQVLSSTGSGTAWVNQGEATATSLYDLLPAARTTYDWTVQLTAGTWADIFSSNTVLSNGTWMVQAFVSDFAVGGQQYSETYSGVMSWGSASGTNNNGVDAESEIILHRSGHAAQAGNFYLRTVERAASTLLFQGMSNQTYSAASTINFKFVKIF